MTPERFRGALGLVGLSTGTLAAWLDADGRLVRRWYSGARAVPDDVGVWLELLERHWIAHPPPSVRGRARN